MSVICLLDCKWTVGRCKLLKIWRRDRDSNPAVCNPIEISYKPNGSFAFPVSQIGFYQCYWQNPYTLFVAER